MRLQKKHLINAPSYRVEEAQRAHLKARSPPQYYNLERYWFPYFKLKPEIVPEQGFRSGVGW